MTVKSAFFKHLQIVVALLLIDIFFSGFPCMTLIGLFVFLLFWTASLTRQLALRWWKKEPFQSASPKLAAAALYLFSTAMVSGFWYWKLRVNDARGEMIAAACESYKAKYAGYPDKLEKLVPEFLPSMPAPLFSTGFLYNPATPDGDYSLMYMLHMFAFRAYSFKKKTWVIRD